MTTRKFYSIPSYVSVDVDTLESTTTTVFEKPYVIKLPSWTPGTNADNTINTITGLHDYGRVDAGLTVSDGYTVSSGTDSTSGLTVTQAFDDWIDWIPASASSGEIVPGRDKVTITATGAYWESGSNAGLHWVDQAAYDRAMKQDMFVNRMRRNLIEPGKVNHRGDAVRARMFAPDYSSESELTALSLLKSLVDARQWRQYLTYGFVMVRGKSGLQYQVRRGRSHVRVFSRYGRLLAELCLNPKTNVPPTDHAVMKLLMLQSGESGFWGRANVYSRYNGVGAETVFNREIVEAA